MRLLAILAALPLLTTFTPATSFRAPPIPDRATLAFEPIALFGDDPARTRIGPLTYLGGWALTSNDPRFGGLSALHAGRNRATAMSDAGWLVRFTLPDRGAPALAIATLPDGPGSAAVKSHRDAESLVVHGRRAWIGFERRNAVWRYARRNWRSEAHAAPPAMRKWPGNEGSEAMLRLADGRFLVFAEGRKGPARSTEALLFAGDPALPGTKAVRLGYRAPAGYRITDAALLPGGRILFLNRRFALFEGFSAKLTIGRVADAAAGRVMTGTEIATLEAPAAIDNMEAVSVVREGDRTIVWLASDDNFTAMQRSLLLKFALAN